MKYGLGSFVLMLIGVAGASGIDNGVDPGQPAGVEQLIAQLGHRDARVREEAGQALEARGSAALPALRQAREHTDPEVRRRIAGLLAVLENAAFLEPKHVRLQLENKPIREIVAELARQTGYRIQLSDGPKGDQERVHSVNLDRIPFWQALDKVCAEGGLALVNDGGDEGRISLQFSDQLSPFIFHNGLVRFVAHRFEYNRGIELRSVPRNLANLGDRWENLTFQFGIMLEPRTPLLGMAPVQLLEATDDLGNSMLLPPADTSRANRPFFHSREFIQEASTSLVRVSPEARLVKRLRGVVPLTLLVEQKPEFIVDGVTEARNKNFKSAQTELVVQALEKNPQDGNRYSLKFSVRNVGTRSEYNFYDSIRSRFELLDAKGNKYRWSGGSWGGSDTHVQGNFSFAHPGGSAGPPTRLIFYDWTALLHRVAFEFKDLPLP